MAYHAGALSLDTYISRQVTHVVKPNYFRVKVKHHQTLVPNKVPFVSLHNSSDFFNTAIVCVLLLKLLLKTQAISRTFYWLWMIRMFYLREDIIFPSFPGRSVLFLTSFSGLSMLSLLCFVNVEEETAREKEKKSNLPNTLTKSTSNNLWPVLSSPLFPKSA